MEKQKEEGGAPPSSRCKDHQVHVGFGNLARIVSERWKVVDPVYKKELEEKARQDKRSVTAMKAWRAKQEKDTAKEDESDFSTVDDAPAALAENNDRPANANGDSASAAADASEAETFFWESYLPEEADAEPMDLSVKALQPHGFPDVASVPNTSERKQSFGSLECPDSYERANTMFKLL